MCAETKIKKGDAVYCPATGTGVIGKVLRLHGDDKADVRWHGAPGDEWSKRMRVGALALLHPNGGDHVR